MDELSGERLMEVKQELFEEDAQNSQILDNKVSIKQECCEFVKNTSLQSFNCDFGKEEGRLAKDLGNSTSNAFTKLEDIELTETTVSTAIYLQTEPPEEILHFKEKRFKCSICGNAFSQSGHLKRHVMSHTGERPYTCAICDHRSTRRGGLVLHMRTHTGERPLKCSECDYSCAQHGNLTRHIRRHTGERPYKCGVCGHAARQSGDIKKHMVTHLPSSGCNKRRKRSWL